MDRKKARRIIKPQELRGADWDDVERRFPDAFTYLWRTAVHNELQRGECSDDRRRELLWQLADQALEERRWDHRFL